nr:uncharacterized protein LOC111423797 [Onthophagus taurus]
MLMKIALFLLTTTVVTSKDNSDTTQEVRIDIQRFGYCYIKLGDIQPPKFTCVQDDKTPERFNSTHAWHIEKDIKCISAIPTIKEIAKGKCKRFHPHLVEIPSTHGTDARGKPVKDKDVFQ